MTGNPKLPQDLAHRLELIRSIEDVVRQEMATHIERRNLWMPDDLGSADIALGEERDAELRELRERARGLPAAVRVAVALNLLTEEGLPHFHRPVSDTHLTLPTIYPV